MTVDTSRSLLLVTFIAALGSGCGPAPHREDETSSTSAGSETAPSPPRPPLSFLPDAQHVFARIDVARIRRSPVGPDISSAIRATETWQAYAGASGLDPVEACDSIVIAADAVYADRRTILLRHTGSDADVREAILRMSVARGAAPVWSEVDGLAVVVPAQTLPIEHSLALTALHEIVLTPSDDVSRVAMVARDHAARRTTPDEALDPQLAFAPNEVANIRVDEPMARREGWPEPPQRYGVQVLEEPTSHTATVLLHAEYATPALCHTAREFLAAQAAYYAGQMLVRAAGLNRPLESAVFTESGTNLDISTTLTIDEIRRALGAMALMQLSSAR